MQDFTAELEQVFGVAPSGETGLVIDTFDGAGFGGETRNCGICRGPEVLASWTRVETRSCGGTTRVGEVRACGNTRVSVPA